MSFRIIAGRARGTRLEVPDGPVRPTTDRVRESLFNVLSHRLGGFDGLRVLDLFAGAGTLGLEAASRGAAHVELVEHNAKVAAVLQRNAQRLDARIHRSTVAAALARPASPFDLVFLDPPYAQGLIAPTLQALVDGGWLAPEALVCVEHPADEVVAPPPPLEVDWTRRYGRTGITLLSAEA